jgi:hypothetical protein
MLNLEKSLVAYVVLSLSQVNWMLMNIFQSLSPFKLLQQINDNLKLLWEMAEKQPIQ